MAGLIKSAEANTWRRIGPVGSVSLPDGPAKIRDSATVKVEALQQELQAQAEVMTGLRAEVSRLTEANASAFENGKVVGRQTGLDEADASRTLALERLGSGVATAITGLNNSLAAMENVAVALACEGLEKVIGPHADRGALLALAIRKQLAEMDAGSVVDVRVSSAEFADPNELTALAQGIGRSGLVLVATDDLKPGDCLIKLKLGALEIGLNQQWTVLKAALEEMAGR